MVICCISNNGCFSKAFKALNESNRFS
ncbi:hypothetical protein DBL04_09515 [Acinetobacter seifertii]|nr:hypothetical protein DBL04_09515 [Acinetobacter seifertii]